MNLRDCQWTIDTLRKEEDILREMAREAMAADDDRHAAQLKRICRELFGLRQLLEHHRVALEKTIAR